MIPFKNGQVQYSDHGEGPAIVLLHGYLETHEIWSDFGSELAKHFRVIAMDLPGHGKSGKIAEVHSMDLLAEALDAVLTQLGVHRAFLVGHSMGGYVALAYLANYRSKVSGICLFHSTPFADTDEKRANRDREIEIIRQGRQEVLFATNVPKGFANDNLIKFHEKVEWAKGVAGCCQPEGIISILEGMKVRHDRQELLKNTAIPVLYILGKKDNYIPYDVMYTVAQRSQVGEVLTLEKSGHMGFVEEPGTCLDAITSFVMQYQ